MHRYRHANIRWTFVFINLVESSYPSILVRSAQYPRKHVQLMIDYEITTNSHHYNVLYATVACIIN